METKPSMKRWGICRFLPMKKLRRTVGREVVNLELQSEYEKTVVNIENGFLVNDYDFKTGV